MDHLIETLKEGLLPALVIGGTFGLIYALITGKLIRKSVDKELDRIYDSVDKLMKTGQFSALDKLLARVEVKSASVDILLGYLTATLPAKKSLLGRSYFFDQVRLELIKLDEDPVALLKGLE